MPHPARQGKPADGFQGLEESRVIFPGFGKGHDEIFQGLEKPMFPVSNVGEKSLYMRW
jgi:hypothetical protein